MIIAAETLTTPDHSVASDSKQPVSSAYLGWANSDAKKASLDRMLDSHANLADHTLNSAVLHGLGDRTTEVRVASIRLLGATDKVSARTAMSLLEHAFTLNNAEVDTEIMATLGKRSDIADTDFANLVRPNIVQRLDPKGLTELIKSASTRNTLSPRFAALIVDEAMSSTSSRVREALPLLIAQHIGAESPVAAEFAKELVQLAKDKRPHVAASALKVAATTELGSMLVLGRVVDRVLQGDSLDAKLAAVTFVSMRRDYPYKKAYAAIKAVGDEANRPRMAQSDRNAIRFVTLEARKVMSTRVGEMISQRSVDAK